MWTKKFWSAAFERAIKSAAQALIGAGVLDGTNVLHLNWLLIAAIGLGAAGLSVLTSIVTSGIGQKGSPSAISTGE